MVGGIFISYRRDDARHAAGRLVDRLSRTFSPQQLFLDVDSIGPGVDFRKAVTEKVQACDVMLVIIGPGWLVSNEARGGRRLDNPADVVRVEIETALGRDIRVIPVLVDGARMPPELDLPETLRPLSYRNAVRLEHERFSADADDLTRQLTTIVAPTQVGGNGAALSPGQMRPTVDNMDGRKLPPADLSQASTVVNRRQELKINISDLRTRRLTTIFTVLAVLAIVLISIFLDFLTGFAFFLGGILTSVLGHMRAITRARKPRIAISVAAVVMVLVVGILCFLVLTIALGFVPVSKIVIDSLVALLLGAATGWAYAMTRVGWRS